MANKNDEEKILEREEKIEQAKEKIKEEQAKINKLSKEIEEIKSLEIQGLLKQIDLPFSEIKDLIKGLANKKGKVD